MRDVSLMNNRLEQNNPVLHGFGVKKQELNKTSCFRNIENQIEYWIAWAQHCLASFLRWHCSAPHSQSFDGASSKSAWGATWHHQLAIGAFSGLVGWGSSNCALALKLPCLLKRAFTWCYPRQSKSHLFPPLVHRSSHRTAALPFRLLTVAPAKAKISKYIIRDREYSIHLNTMKHSVNLA